MKVIGIDPGTTKSGVVLWGSDDDSHSILHAGVTDNGDVAGFIRTCNPDVVAIEWIQSMGMVVGKEVFETCLWVGRFVEFSVGIEIPCRCVPRGVIKLHHCMSPRANDSNISQALRDKYGQKGTKKDPGFFFGVAGHAWQACAVAAYVAEGGRDPSEILYSFTIDD